MILNFRITFLLIAVLFMVSCKQKDNTSTLGLDVQPENDLLNITISDTSSIFMHTQKVDSTRTYNDGIKYLGSTQDPIFGRTDAAIYTNFSITNNLTNLSFGTDAVLDSAEMVIYCTGLFTGEYSTPLTYKVHLINEVITNTTPYYTSQKFAHASSIVNTTSGVLTSRSNSLCLVFKLDYNMAKYILETEANLTNNTAFQAANKGFYITSENTALSGPNTGAIRQFDLDNILSGINLHYHKAGSTIPKGEVFQFSFRGVDAARTNYFKRNYSSANTELKTQLAGDSSVASNNLVYLNSFGGTRTRVYLPYLKNFSDSQTVSISRAELIIKVDPTAISSTTPNFSAPNELALIACGSGSNEELVWDQIESTDFAKYSGTYDAANQQYVFNIARQMQKIVSKKITNYGFYLVNANPSKSVVVRRDNRKDRIVIGGKTNAMYKPVFRVTYIKFPHDK